MPSISLRSTRYPELELRTATLDDVAAVREIFSNPENTAYDPVVSDPARFTVERVEGMIQRWAKAQEEEKPGGISVVVVVDGGVACASSLAELEPDEPRTKPGARAGL